MSVYTNLSRPELDHFLRRYRVGQLRDLCGDRGRHRKLKLLRHHGAGQICPNIV